jgi:hypothetical protein
MSDRLRQIAVLRGRLERLILVLIVSPVVLENCRRGFALR